MSHTVPHMTRELERILEAHAEERVQPQEPELHVVKDDALLPQHNNPFRQHSEDLLGGLRGWGQDE